MLEPFASLAKFAAGADAFGGVSRARAILDELEALRTVLES